MSSRVPIMERVVEGQRHMSFLASSVPNVPNFLDKKPDLRLHFVQFHAVIFMGKNEEAEHSHAMTSRVTENVYASE